MKLTETERLTTFYQIVAKYPQGTDAETLTAEYNKGRKQPKIIGTIRIWLQKLREIGYVSIEDDTVHLDKRFNNYIPLKPKETAIALIPEISTHSEVFLEKNLKATLKNTLAENPTAQIIILNITLRS